MATPKALRRAAWERAGGRCEITGVWLGEPDGDTWALHHRRAKGMGGSRLPDTETLPNVLAISHAIHNLGPRPAIHLDPAWAYDESRGYLLRRHQVPARSPFLLRGRDLVLLGEHGGYLAVTQ